MKAYNTKIQEWERLVIYYLGTDGSTGLRKSVPGVTVISNTHPGRYCNERFTLSVKIHTMNEDGKQDDTHRRGDHERYVHIYKHFVTIVILTGSWNNS